MAIRHEHEVTGRINLEATAKRSIKTIVWKKTDQKESDMWHKLKAHRINEEITTHGTIKKGYAGRAGEKR